MAIFSFGFEFSKENQHGSSTKIIVFIGILLIFHFYTMAWVYASLEEDYHCTFLLRMEKKNCLFWVFHLVILQYLLLLFAHEKLFDFIFVAETKYVMKQYLTFCWERIF